MTFSVEQFLSKYQCRCRRENLFILKVDCTVRVKDYFIKILSIRHYFVGSLKLITLY